MLSNEDIIMARRRGSSLRSCSRIAQLGLGVAACIILYSAFVQPEGQHRLGFCLLACGLCIIALALSTWIHSASQTIADNAELLQDIQQNLHKQNTDKQVEG
ncbi:MAG: hypothetical protein ACIAXF_16965 [Phycisphaerales bacterium JB063]